MKAGTELRQCKTLTTNLSHEMNRPRGRHIKMFGTPEELAAIVGKAASVGMSRSAYLRAAGLNQPTHSALDLEAVRELAKVNGDLGRVAGLLKLWLATKKGEGARPKDVERMMNEFRELQKMSHQIMGRMIR